ncbi:hypothetical protein M436DRAFT_81773 [Aureobasidium namibiae CBS 147.97]|uniref:Uncharacterized protein n=1 Tax=Aureobasidium namibiae CBS 147.97 TaxID=1043004 RepID=A0A074WJS1_9PEZI
MSSIHREPDPRPSFQEFQRRCPPVVNSSTPVSDRVPTQPALPSREIRRFYQNSLPSISESINESEYSAETASYEEVHASRAQSITLPEQNTNPPKAKPYTKIYSGLARLTTKSSTNIAELSSATKEKLKKFTLTRSKSTYDLLGLLSPSPSPSPSVASLLPTDTPQTIDRSSVPVSQSKSPALIHSIESSTTKSRSKWTKARLSLRASLSREELSGGRPLQMRSSDGHWSSPHRPGRSTTDENGSPVILRPHESPSSNSLSSLQAHAPDPVTPPPPSLQSPQVFRPVVSTPNSSGSSHFFTPVASTAALPPSKSTHNFKPVTTHDSPSPESGHNFKPIVFDDSRSPRSPHDNKPLIIKNPPSPKSGHNPKPNVLDEPKSPNSPQSLKSILVTPGSAHKTPCRRKSVGFKEPETTAGASSVFADSRVVSDPASALPDPYVNSGPSFGFAYSNVTTSPSDRSLSRPEQPPFIPPEARFLIDPLTMPFKVRYKPYVPREQDPGEVTFPNGLDGNNPYPRPYGGGKANDRYHLFETLPEPKLLADPDANPYKDTKKLSHHNYYGGRSAAQRESTRHVHRLNNDNLVEGYEMDNLSGPQPEPTKAPSDAKPKSFVGTAVSTLTAARKPKPKPKAKAKAKAKAEYDEFSLGNLVAELKVVNAAEKAQKKREAKEWKKAQKGPGLLSRWRQHREEQLLARAKRNYAKDVEEERKRKEAVAAPSSPPVDQPDNGLVEHHEPLEASREARELQRALDMEEARRGKKKL